ncbi:chemotaxis protein CheA [Thermanaerovibrio acidaminovorans]|uniref:Chemotaxis protein CheA n=1 Tax=Thermanaerovibrio acidaminovorans (strain ATCC 49978 / DSM 6589 / Su883) TaxID=525903 RepID=D1B6A0_THEAS|nr:chemotaxis protein CheA [Thermanaerovibrio acidaminovorans]ACZ19541.1 CheA signal transduction histidine kinase [Thermanaerovibrio acidaminovorans DSM 6589]
MTNMDMSQYIGAFLDEATDQLKNLNELLLAAEQNQSDMGIINEIFRVAHTFKGMSATMGFDSMAGLTHAMEDLLGLARSGEHVLNSEDVDLLFKCLDAITAMVDNIRGGGSDKDVDVKALVEQLHRLVNKAHEAPAAKPAKVGKKVELTEQERGWVKEARHQGMAVYELRVALSPSCMLKAARAYMVVTRLGEMGELIKTQPGVEDLEREAFDTEFWVYVATHETGEALSSVASSISEVASVEVTPLNFDEDGGLSIGDMEDDEDEEEQSSSGTPQVSQGQQPQAGAAQAPQQGSKKGSRTVRVDIGRLDKLMNLVGELVIGRARIERLAQETKIKAFDEPLSQLGRISGEIQELVTKLRMVPVSMVFDRLPRLVRDLSRQMGKEVRLVVEGRETELDRTVIDEIGDPMVHLLRNSLDHGLESPEERERNGKPREGTITVAAYQEGNGVIIEVQDDGRGIDTAKVRRKAVERGIVTAEQAQMMTDEEAIRLILLPGFSTADVVTDLSGRGVGMDAVKSKVESLGGQFQVFSKLGEGTRVVIRLPLTLAIVLALLIRVGDEIYAISLENVEETLLVPKSEIKYVHGTPVTTVRGEILTLSDLAGILSTPVDREGVEEHPVVVVRVGRDRNRIGFVVDDFVGQQEIVIKPLGKLLQKVRGVAGATILGDGNVALILDAASL